jgi:hypothetical protein
MTEAKLLKNIKGFDDVGIGLINCGEGDGTYVLCTDLEGYDLTDVQIYKYHTFLRTMSKADKIEENSRNYLYFVKRADLT